MTKVNAGDIKELGETWPLPQSVRNHYDHTHGLSYYSTHDRISIEDIMLQADERLRDLTEHTKHITDECVDFEDLIKSLGIDKTDLTGVTDNSTEESRELDWESVV